MAACRPYLKFEAHECENNHTGGRGGLDTGKLLKAFNWDVMLAKGSSRRTCQIICACMSWSIPLISGQIENNLRDLCNFLLSSAALVMAGEHADEDQPGSCSALRWPEKGALARCWEARALVREQVGCQKKLLLWPSPVLTGVASQNALKMNKYVVADIIKIWSGSCGEPQPPPVAWLRQEAYLFVQNLHATCPHMGIP